MGGLAIGIVFLIVFLSGKRARCTYFPEERVLADFAKKPIRLSDNLREKKEDGTLDTMALKKIIKYGDVDFSLLDRDSKPCPTYHVNGKQELEDVFLKIQNCDRYIRVMEMGED
jgi:hypothetical protein